MTVQTNTNVASFNGNGVTQIFPIAFKFNSDTDLVVLLVDDATGTISQLTLNSDYTVSGEGDEDGGLINVVVAPASGKRLKVTRLVDILQLTDLRNQGKFFAEVHEDALDLLTMIAQQHDTGIRSALRVAESDPEPARLPPVAQRAGRLMAFDQDGNPTTALPIADSSTALRDELASNGGAAIIGTAAGKTVEQRLDEIAETQAISPFDYGAVGDGIADDTAAMNAAYAAVKAQGVKIFDLSGGNFRVSHIELDAPNGLLIRGGGSITGMSTGSYESVLTIRDGADCVIDGRLVVSASYNSGYTSAVALYSTDAGGFSKALTSGLSYHGAKTGLRVGIDANPDALLSETTVFGGYFYGCPTCVELVGNQLVYNLVGMHLITGVEGAPTDRAAEWASLPRTAVRSFGANWTLIGGSSHIVEVTTGILFDMRPIASQNVDIGNRYGTGTVIGTNIECASELARLWNPAGLSGLKKAGGFQMTAVNGYHSQDTAPLIVAYDDFPGYIDVRGNPGFNTPSPRTNVTINAGMSNCDIFADESSFGVNFKSGFSGVSGGILHFGEQKIAELRNLASQAISAGASNTLKFTEKPEGVVGNTRFGVLYDTATGVFNVPEGGLKSLRVNVCLDLLLARPDSLVNVSVDGVITAYAGTSGSRYLNAVLDVGDVPAGALVRINFVAQGGTSAFSFATSANDRVSFYARR